MWLLVGLWKCSSIDSIVFLFVFDGLIRVMVLFGWICRLKWFSVVWFGCCG